jgi:hypothetical protein
VRPESKEDSSLPVIGWTPKENVFAKAAAPLLFLEPEAFQGSLATVAGPHTGQAGPFLGRPGPQAQHESGNHLVLPDGRNGRSR